MVSIQVECWACHCTKLPETVRKPSGVNRSPAPVGSMTSTLSLEAIGAVGDGVVEPGMLTREVLLTSKPVVSMREAAQVAEPAVIALLVPPILICSVRVRV